MTRKISHHFPICKLLLYGHKSVSIYTMCYMRRGKMSWQYIWRTFGRKLQCIEDELSWDEELSPAVAFHNIKVAVDYFSLWPVLSKQPILDIMYFGWCLFLPWKEALCQPSGVYRSCLRPTCHQSLRSPPDKWLLSWEKKLEKETLLQRHAV